MTTLGIPRSGPQRGGARLFVIALIATVNAALVGFTLAAPTVRKETTAAKQHQISAAPAGRYVIHISVDGMGARWYRPMVEAGILPNFQRLQREGSWTYYARSDADFTITLPNHTGMLTGRPVFDQYGDTGTGHQWITNTTPALDTTLHTNAGYYIASALDTAHDNGLSTGLYASKDKFVLYDQSYSASSGAPDTTGIDNGRDKIDVFVNNDLNSTAALATFLDNMSQAPTAYTFVHIADPDSAGHAFNWGSLQYELAVQAADAKVGRILSLIDRSPTLRGKTWVIVSADHGGTGLSHGDNFDPLNYRIPFLLWGPNIPANGDLYVLAQPAARFPDLSRPVFARGPGQPIRNSDGGNCAMAILDLPEITGSSVRTLYDFCGAPRAQNTAQIARMSNWRYSDADRTPGAAWRESTFDDSAWPSGPGPLGFGDPVSTTLASGAQCEQASAAYFRATMNITDTSSIAGATLSLRRDDGAVVYLNGVEITRSNMPTGAITHDTQALTATLGVDEQEYADVEIPWQAFVSGRNVLAAEVHQVNACSTDLMFDAALRLHRAGPAATLTPTPTASPSATPAITPVARYSFSLPVVLR
jgi:hypothetical protein